MSTDDQTQTPTDKNDNEESTESAPVIVQDPKALEKEQEAELRAKYPALKVPGRSAFLQKRLSKGQKYFDSGDYNMARAKTGPAQGKVSILPGKPLLPGTTGDAIPTPETLPGRKPSLIQSKLASGQLS